MLLRLLLGCLIHPIVWIGGSLVLDQVTGVSSSGAVFLLISLNIAGESVGGIMLIMSVLMVFFREVRISVRFLGLCRQLKGLLCSLLMLCSWG